MQFFDACFPTRSASPIHAVVILISAIGLVDYQRGLCRVVETSPYVRRVAD